MTSLIKITLGPLLVMAAISTMYFMSINTNEPINRADVAFMLMSGLAAFHLWAAYAWYQKGYQTFLQLKQIQNAAVSAIDEILRKLKKEAKSNIHEKASMEVPDGAIDNLTDIINKHKS